ncbi:MAG: sulfite exporter TauE/SafE family protein [Geminicoccaceae bacterium]
MPVDFDIALLVGGTFFLAGLIKGLVGVGLPTVALGLLTTAFGITQAIAILLVPAILTNVAQAFGGRDTKRVAARFWPMLLPVCIGVWFGTGVLARTTSDLPAAMLGFLIALHSAISLMKPDLPSPARHERWLSPLVGLVNGTITGFTGSSVIPGLMYLQALGLKKEELVQAMGMLFGLSSLILFVAFARYELVDRQTAMISAGALVPAFAGMAAGRAIRLRISEDRFRRWLLFALLLLGLHVMLRALA